MIDLSRRGFLFGVVATLLILCAFGTDVQLASIAEGAFHYVVDWATKRPTTPSSSSYFLCMPDGTLVMGGYRAATEEEKNFCKSPHIKD